MIFGDFNRIIFRDFKEKAALLILEEIKEQKPSDEFQLAEILADLGAQALITPYGNVCVLTNIKGLYDGQRETGERFAAVESCSEVESNATLHWFQNKNE